MTGNAQNSALTLNGTSDYATTSAYLVPASGDFTVELWVYATAGGARQFVSQGASGSGFFIGMNASNNIWLGDNWPATSVAMPLNQWTHLAVVKSGTNGTLYVNGISSATRTGYSVSSGGTAFYIGKQYGAVAQYAQGSLDEIRVWNVARTASQVKEGMYGTIATNSANLVAYYQLNEGSGTIIANNSTSTSVASASNATLVSGSWLADSPVRRSDNGLHFDGTDDYFKTGTSTDYESASATIECWVRTEQLVGNACILGYRSASTRYSFHMNASTIGMWNGSAYLTKSYTFTPSQWYHLAFVMTASATEIFVNGTSIGNTGNVRSNVTGVEFFVGVAMSNTLSIMEPFKGTIDDIRIWNVARTGTQIQSNMYSDLTGTETNLVRYWNLNQGIAGGTNTGLTKAIDLTDKNGHGQLTNMGLTGNSSNWISHSTAVLNPPPVITSFSPATAAAGASVSIVGNNFNTTASNNIVRFGTTRATVTAATTTSLTVNVPNGSMYKPISVTNTAYGLTGYSSSPFIATFPGGNGSINYSTAFNLTTGNNPQGIDIDDIDGDGKNDLVVANGSGSSISIFRNIHSTGVIANTSFDTRADFTTGAAPSAVMLGDVDGDGKKDVLVVQSGAGVVSVFRNISTSGSILLGSRVDFTFTNNGRSIALADINKDGRPEMIIGASGYVYVYPNTATTGTISSGSFGSPVAVRSSGGDFRVSVRDMDGDGNTDIVGTEFTGSAANLFVMRNVYSSGNIVSASFATPVNFPVTMTADAFGAPATGDLDGDGKPDIVIANPTEKNVWVFRNTSSSGSFTTGSLDAAVKLATGTASSAVGLADLNGDGKLDIFTSNNTGNNVSTFKNAATSGAITAASFADGRNHATANGSIALAAADLDNDGKAELAVSAAGAASLSVLPNISSNVVLPLRFIYARGRIEGADALIDWKTADEINTDRFEIEQSSDGQQFRLAGIVAAVNEAGEHLYSFKDPNAITPSTSILYYRIKQKDLNGHYTYSPVIRLQKQTAGNSVTLYPNPVVDKINVSLTLTSRQAIAVRIFDNKGSLVKMTSFNLAAGSNSVYIDASNLSKGVYYLDLKSETLDQRIRFVK